MYEIVQWFSEVKVVAIVFVGFVTLTWVSWVLTKSRASRVQGAGVLNISNLSSELRTVTDWYQLGINLGLQTHELRGIKHDYQEKELQKHEMLDLWLRRKPDAAWEDVACALQQMGENRVAETIFQKYITEGSKF